MGRNRIERKSVMLRITEDQYRILKRKAFVEDLSFQVIFNALTNAYITGDLTVKRDGRYAINQPLQNVEPVVQYRDKDQELVEVRPDWQTKTAANKKPQPQVPPSRKAHRKNKSENWGTKEARAYLRGETGRKVDQQVFYQLLHALEIPKAGARYKFTGPDDPHILKLKEGIESGLYDELKTNSLKTAVAHTEAKKKQKEDFIDAETMLARKKKLDHVKRLQEIAKSKEVG